MGKIGYPETSARNYNLTLPNVPEERRPQDRLNSVFPMNKFPEFMEQELLLHLLLDTQKHFVRKLGAVMPTEA
jgi:hypothetical protein